MKRSALLFKIRACICTAILFIFFATNRSFAQCISLTQFPTSTITLPSAINQTVTVSTCMRADRYCRTGSAVTGNTYTFASSNSSDFLTVRISSFIGTVVIMGTTPLTYTATSTAAFYVHVNTNSSCGTSSACRTLTIQRIQPQCSGTPTAGSITAAGGTTFCGSGSPTFTASGYSTTLAGIGLQWEYSTNGGSTWNNYSGATTNSLNPGPITTTTIVRCAVNCSYSGITSYTNSITVTINPNPTLSTTTPHAFTCSTGASTTLSVSGTGTSYSWTPSTSLSSTTASTVTATPSSSIAYTVTSTLGPCNVSKVIPVNVATPPLAPAPTVTPSSICYDGSVQLSSAQAAGGYTLYRIDPALHAMTNPQTPTFSNLDNGSVSVTLPFSFEHYGNTYSTLYISNNGYVGFNSASMTSSTPQTLPATTNPDNVIALFWHNLDMGNGGTITYSTEGTAPDRKFIIYFDDVKDDANPTLSNNKGQIILYETTFMIDLLVTETYNTGTTYSRTLGIEDVNGTNGLAPANRNNSSWSISSSQFAEGYRIVRPLHTYAWTPATNLSNATVFDPVATNNISTTTFTATITDTITGCTSSGTATLTVHPLPLATLSVSPDTICDGQSATINFSGTPGATVYFNKDGFMQAPIVLNGGGTAIFNTGMLSATTTFTLDSARSAQGCLSLFNLSDPVVVNIRPQASITGTQTICNGSSTNVTINALQGAGPWTVSYTDGSNTFTQTFSGSSYVFPVTPSVNTTYTLTAVSDALCTGISSDISGLAFVDLDPRPTAALSIPAAVICNGVTQNLTVTFTGNPPYSFDVFDGTSTTSYTNIWGSTYAIPLSISTTTTYSVTALNDANCSAWSVDLGNPVTVNVHPRPTSVIGGSDVICNGNSSSAVNVNFTGTAPWDFSYFDGNNMVAMYGITSSPYALTLSPNAAATYTVTALSDANNCSAYANEMTGSGDIVVNYSPVIISGSGGVNACSGDQAIFSVNATGTNLTYQWKLNGSNLVNGGVYSGTNTATLNISDITGLGGSIYQVEIGGTCPPVISSTQFSLVESTHNQWAGTSNSLWSNPSNWSCGILPTAVTDVTILPSAPYQPDIDIPTAICKGLLIYPGANVEMTGNNNGLEVKRDIVNLGGFDAHLGKLTMSGNVQQSAPGVIYKDLEIQGGTIKTFTGNLVVTNMLNLYSGYIRLGQNNLVLGQNAGVFGSSPSSFVITNGTGKVVGDNMGLGANTGSVLFPVGTDEFSYTPVMISNSGTADDINVRVIDGLYAEYNGDIPSGTQWTADAVGKTWLIHETIPGGSNASITPQWTFADNLTGFNSNNCAVIHYTGGNWEADALGVATGFSPYTRTLTGVTSFSPFSVSSASSLALELLSFSGSMQAADARLKWQSTNEKDMSVYELQRSIDNGISYDKVVSVTATGNGKAGNNNYGYTDEDVTRLDAKKILYRLKMSGNSGSYTYSNIIALTPGTEAITASIGLYPNPVDGSEVFLDLGSDEANAVGIEIMDLSGRVISKLEYAADSYDTEAMKVDVSKLPAGLYMIRLSGEDGVVLETLRFSKL